MHPPGKFHALLATARIANVPSVLSNIGVGVLLGSGLQGGPLRWPWWLLLAGVMFYIAGNFFNDWMDRHWDRHYRPERALPRALFTPNSYLLTALMLSLAALSLTAIYGLQPLIIALVLVGLIILYTRIHKTTPQAVIPMGMCRGTLPVLGYLAVQPELTLTMWIPALALMLYVIALSCSARGESRGDLATGEKLPARMLLIFSGILAAVYPMMQNPALGWIGLIAFLAWMALSLTKYRHPIPAHVSALLAGIPLVDWAFLFPLALIRVLEGVVPIDGPVFYTGLLLSPACFVTGRVLQRVAPAT